MHADSAAVDRFSGFSLGCVFGVMNAPGAGFPETTYENALAHELGKPGLPVMQ